LTHANKGEAEIIAGVEEANLEVMPLLNKRTAALAGMGSLATLLGLLGTVMGLIEAFTVVAKHLRIKNQLCFQPLLVSR
jgi:biopolymer transport protein ExbB/TolQ